MNYDFQKDFILVTGISGSGKTTLWKKLIDDSKTKWKFIFDPDGEYARHAKVGRCITVEHMNEAAARMRPVCYDYSHYFPGQPAEGFAWFCRWVVNVSKVLKGAKCWGVDEIWKVTKSGKVIPQSCLEILNEGRKFEIRGRIICQAVNEVHWEIRKQLDFIYSLQHVEPGCLKWLKERGFDPEEIQRLPKYAFIIRDLNKCETIRPGNASNAKRKRNR